MKYFPDDTQACWVPDIRAVVELVQVDADGDPFYMQHDDLVMARHVGTDTVATWSASRLSRAMMRAAKASR